VKGSTINETGFDNNKEKMPQVNRTNLARTVFFTLLTGVAGKRLRGEAINILLSISI